MSSSLHTSILSGARPDALKLHPFPHIIIKNALEISTYSELEKNYPNTELIRNSTEVLNRHQIQAKDALTHDEIHPVWKSFITYHTSNTFYLELLSLFQDSIREYYPWLEDSLGKSLQEFSVGIRDPKLEKLPDVCLDCQPGLNTVQSEGGSVRSPHLDARNKLITGLFYLKPEYDSSQGGDLKLFEYTTPRPKFSSPSTPTSKDIKWCKTVSYGANTAVFFLNTPQSVHGVSIRDATTIPRRLVNIIAGLYSLPKQELFPAPEHILA